MNKYSSLYLSEVFNGIQKNAFSWGQNVIKPVSDVADQVAPGAVSQSATSKFIPKGIPAGGIKGLGAGLAATTALDSVTPEFKNDSYWGQVGNELRSFGVNTAGSAAGAAAVTGGAAALPGAIQGAAFDVGSKLWRAGKGLNELFNPYSELNTSRRDTERISKEMAQRFSQRNNKVTPASTPVRGSSLGAGKSKQLQQNRESLEKITAPATPPISPATPTPSTTSTGLTPQQKLDKATVARVRAQRDKAYEYAGVNPQNPPKNFSGVVPPQQQTTSAPVPPPATPAPPQSQTLAQATPAATSAKPAIQAPTPAAAKNLNVIKGQYGTAVGGGSLMDKLKADGKIPQDFQLTKEMRIGQQALPPEIQKAKDEFLRSSKATS